RNHKERRELFPPRAAANPSEARNTCAAERKRETGRLSEPSIQTLWRESGSLAETNFDAIHQYPSKCWRPFLPASPPATPSDCSRKPGVARSSRNAKCAKLQWRQVPFFCHR